ncbi:hypothetical protein MKY20_14670 [Cytobacillus sp. FSL W8-0315]|uniref:hypothetical protein n=1 Tax=Cytobacillus sp. FSL W8-0315 TaxID=2921600 RepID=UPI0030F6760F
MNCKVITYTNPKTLDQLEGFKSYKDVLHVCATKNMRDGVYERYQKKEMFITAPIVSSVNLLESLLGDWYSAETKLMQYLHLSEIIQDDIPMRQNLLSSFRRNQIEVLETIRMLEVSGVTSESLDDEELELSEKENTFLKIWKKFEENQTVRRFRNLLSSGFQNRLTANWSGRVQKLIKDAYNKDDEVLRKLDHQVGWETVVLHGFYFMTPEQQQIFQLIKNAGVNIIFLNLYDARFTETFNFIEKFINERHGWVDKKDWKMEKWVNKRLTLADKFLADFEGEQVEEYQFPNHLKVKDFKDFYDFLQDYENNLDIDPAEKTKYKTYLAPNAATLNDRLQEYYPELFKAKRHFLGYPIGQYLFQLHQMWSEEEDSLILSENVLFECFASGWLYDEITGKNAREYTKALQEVLPFFQGCVTQESWSRRAATLLTIHEHILPPFKEEDDDRFEQMMSSPFSRFSQFAVSIDEVTQIVAFMGMIFRTSSDLFGDGKKRILLADHFSKLRKLIEASNPFLQHEMVKEEKVIIHQLKQKLQTTPDIGAVRVHDISTAISLYLAGHLKKDHSEEDELIRPFIEIDGEAFKQNGITHVTGLDENSLPYSEFKLPWPLTESVFHDLAKRNVPLSFQVLRNEHVKEITRYLVYNLLQFSERLELSWMVHYEAEKNLDKAVYLSQLNLKPNEESRQNHKEWKDVKLDREVTKQELDLFLAFPIDALAEFKFCPRRFYYSYLAGRPETFQSEFVQEFLFGNLLKSFGALLPNLSDEKIKEEVYKLFPYWDEFKLNMIGEENIGYRNWAKKNYGEHTPYGEGKFSDLRKLFLFPVLQNKKADNDSKTVASAIEQLYSSPGEFLPALREEFERQLQEFPIQMEATPSGKCRYCPHYQFCTDAFHSVDDVERKLAK